VVYLPGLCKVTTVTLKPKVTLRGSGTAFSSAGQAPSGLVGTAGADTVLLGTPGGPYTETMTVEHLSIFGGRRGIAIVGHRVTNLTVRDVRVTGSDAGFYCDTWIERSLRARRDRRSRVRLPAHG
jgi:hypothetical protein